MAETGLIKNLLDGYDIFEQVLSCIDPDGMNEEQVLDLLRDNTKFSPE